MMFSELMMRAQLAAIAAFGVLTTGATGALANPTVPEAADRDHALGVLLAPPAEAADLTDGEGIGAAEQVTSVSQLSDVQPTDWAFQALQSLVERYGCIAGYPDGTFRGNRALTRYEFAAGLNACLAKVEELIGTASGDLATKEDLQTLQRLQEEFAAEVAVLRGRVDSLEARTSELEANQFSTTTKLTGSVIFGLQGGTIDDSDREQITFGQRTRLVLETSFTGRDRLFTRLDTNTVENSIDDRTGLGSLSYAGPNGTDFDLSFLAYTFPIGETFDAIVGFDLLLIDTHPHHNPLFGNGSGALSAFGDRNPIFRQPTYGGAGLTWKINDALSWAFMYSAGNPADPSLGSGLFNGSYSASTSINYSKGRFSGGVFYARSYYSDTDLGDAAAPLMGAIGTRNSRSAFATDSIDSDNIGVQLSYRISDGLTAFGWGGYTLARNARDIDEYVRVTNWAFGLAFPDLIKEGSIGGLIVGQPPAVVSSRGYQDDDSLPFHVEALYKFAVNDNIFVTPGAIAVFNADDSDDTAFVGVLRTEFKF
jgi:hypothetical protein